MPALMTTLLGSSPTFLCPSPPQSASPSPNVRSSSKPWKRGACSSSSKPWTRGFSSSGRNQGVARGGNWKAANCAKSRVGSAEVAEDQKDSAEGVVDVSDGSAFVRELNEELKLSSNSSGGRVSQRKPLTPVSEDGNSRSPDKRESLRTYSQPAEGETWAEGNGAGERRVQPRWVKDRRGSDRVWVAPKGRGGGGDEKSEIGQASTASSGQQLEGALNKFLWSDSSPNSSMRVAWPERSSAILEVQRSDDVAAALRRVGKQMETTDMNGLLRQFGRVGKWKDACVLFDWMKVNGKLSAPTYTSFFSLLGKAGQVDQALETFLDLKDRSVRSNIFVWNSLLSTLISNGKIDKAFNFFRVLREEGLEPDRVTYSTMISACSKALGGFYKAQEIVKAMQAKGLKLDSIMYGALINVCASNHMVEEARATFDEMRSLGFPPNLFHFCSLLNAYSLKGRHEEAEQVVLELRKCGLKPNKVVFNSLINAYSRAKLPDMAQETFDRMSEIGLQPDLISYCSLMDSYAKVGAVEDAQAVMNQMKASGLTPGSNGYGILIAAYGKAGSLDMMQKLSQEIETIPGADFDIYLINSLLKVYSEAGFMDGVMNILQKMEAQSCSPNRATFHILIVYFCNENLCNLAIRTLQDMKTRGYPANEVSYTILVQGILKNGKLEECFKQLEQMKEAGISPTKIIYQEMLKYCISFKMLDEAQQLFASLKASRHVTSGVLLGAYLELFANEGRLDVVKDVLQQMGLADYNPKQELWDLLVLKANEQKEYDILKVLLEESRCTPNPRTVTILLATFHEVGNLDHLEKLLTSRQLEEAGNNERKLVN